MASDFTSTRVEYMTNLINRIWEKLQFFNLKVTVDSFRSVKTIFEWKISRHAVCEKITTSLSESTTIYKFTDGSMMLKTRSSVA